MIDIAPYVPGDEATLEGQGAQPTPALAERGAAWTARSDGRVLAIGGFAFNHPDYVTAWGLFAAAKHTALVPIARRMAQALRSAAAAYPRVDMQVIADFGPGHRLALDLGMLPEATLRAAAPNGADIVLWARTNALSRERTSGQGD